MMKVLKRRRSQKTDYRQRIGLIKSGKPRLVVRRSNNGFAIQFVCYETKGDKTIAETNSRALKALGWNGHTGNIPAAYLSGLMAGNIAKKAGINEAVLDMGTQMSTKGNSIYAVVKGVNDAGVKIPVNKEFVPSDGRIKGEHTKGDVKNFEDVKKKIISGA